VAVIKPLADANCGALFSGQGAGGIGGLLARTENPSTINPGLAYFGTAYYHADGNGNITCLIYPSQMIAAKYLYDPFGNALAPQSPQITAECIYSRDHSPGARSSSDPSAGPRPERVDIQALAIAVGNTVSTGPALSNPSTLPHIVPDLVAAYATDTAALLALIT
jgi:hypothetical protein